MQITTPSTPAALAPGFTPDDAIAAITEYWQRPDVRPMTGNLIKLPDGFDRTGDTPPPPSCMCAQGQSLHYLFGMSVDDLLALGQGDADKKIASLFGISRAHAVLLRNVNDTLLGAPGSVLTNPHAHITQPHSYAVLCLWHFMDTLDYDKWLDIYRKYFLSKALSEKYSPWAEAEAEAAAEAAEAAAAAAEAEAAAAVKVNFSRFNWWRLSRFCTLEIIGSVVLKSQEKPLFCLNSFGFSDLNALIAWGTTNGIDQNGVRSADHV